MTNSYFETYFKETDRIEDFDFYEQKEINGQLHIFEFSYTKADILKIILNLPIDIRDKIRKTFIMIDFKNGDIMHFINYMLNGHCKELIRQQIECINENAGVLK
jgi:hypothetical protein